MKLRKAARQVAEVLRASVRLTDGTGFTPVVDDNDLARQRARLEARR